jgi:hypothetical protein
VLIGEILERKIGNCPETGYRKKISHSKKTHLWNGNINTTAEKENLH